MNELIKALKDFIKSSYAWISAYYVKPPTKMPEKIKIDREGNLTKMCLAIQAFEGWREIPPSRSFRNNNPGNFRYNAFVAKELKAIGTDGAFAKWSSYEDGFNALKKFIKMAASNELKVYKNCTIKSFISVYSPVSDGNPSERYGKWVASQVGYPLETPLKEII